MKLAVFVRLWELGTKMLGHLLVHIMVSLVTCVGSRTFPRVPYFEDAVDEGGALPPPRGVDLSTKRAIFRDLQNFKFYTKTFFF